MDHARNLRASTGTLGEQVTRVLFHYARFAVALTSACNGSPSKEPDTASGAVVPSPAIDASPTSDPDPTSPPPPPTVRAGPGDCKTEYAPRPKRDPNPMCMVAGGVFEMGDPKGQHRTVEVSPFAIDQFEVTNQQMMFFLESTHFDERCHVPGSPLDCFHFKSSPSPPITKPNGTYALDPKRARWPFEYTSQSTAISYCAWTGKRLPTEAEWEFAARHDPRTSTDRVYPWGERFDPKRSPQTTLEDSLVYMDVGSNDGVSPWGVHDMAGNVSERVADCQRLTKPCDRGPCRDPVGPVLDDGRCLTFSKGGARYQPATALRSFGHNNGSDGLGGFRCVRSTR
jgi:formylglycine-generating enzyme required for sulfatase activity